MTWLVKRILDLNRPFYSLLKLSRKFDASGFSDGSLFVIEFNHLC